VITLNYEQGSESWLRARCGACTASRFTDARDKVGGLTTQQQIYVEAMRAGKTDADALAAAGYKKRPTSDTVARAMRGESVEEPSAKAIAYSWLIAIETIAREPIDDTFVTFAMRRGRDLEPLARAAYERRTGQWVDEVSLILTDDGHFGYSADGFVGDDGLIEIKCPMSPEKLGSVWENPAGAVAEYIDQINGGLWITGRKWCDLVVYCPWLSAVGKDLFVWRVVRNEESIGQLEDDLMAFWKLVERNLAILRNPTKMNGRPLEEAAAPAAEPAPWDGPTTLPVAPPPADTTPPKQPEAYAPMALDF
jgi:hypothetical protein